MTTSYNYSLSVDFGGSINLSSLHKEVSDEGSITPNLVGINLTDDDVEIVFDSSLSAGEITTLDGLVAVHDGTEIIPKINFYTVTPKYTKTDLNIYFSMGEFKYEGSDTIGDIDYIEIVSSKDSNVTTYSARIIDRTNGTVIAEKNGMNNNIIAHQDLGTISNIPTNTSILELQMKKVGGNTSSLIYVEQIIIYYNN